MILGIQNFQINQNYKRNNSYPQKVAPQINYLSKFSNLNKDTVCFKGWVVPDNDDEKAKTPKGWIIDENPSEENDYMTPQEVEVEDNSKKGDWIYGSQSFKENDN